MIQYLSTDGSNCVTFSFNYQIPYNMERLLLLFSDMNYGRVDSLMRDFEQNKSLIIPEDLKGEVTCSFG